MSSAGETRADRAAERAADTARAEVRADVQMAKAAIRKPPPLPLPQIATFDRAEDSRKADDADKARKKGEEARYEKKELPHEKLARKTDGRRAEQKAADKKREAAGQKGKAETAAREARRGERAGHTRRGERGERGAGAKRNQDAPRESGSRRDSNPARREAPRGLFSRLFSAFRARPSGLPKTSTPPKTGTPANPQATAQKGKPASTGTPATPGAPKGQPQFSSMPKALAYVKANPGKFAGKSPEAAAKQLVKGAFKIFCYSGPKDAGQAAKQAEAGLQRGMANLLFQGGQPAAQAAPPQPNGQPGTGETRSQLFSKLTRGGQKGGTSRSGGNKGASRSDAENAAVGGFAREQGNIPA